MKTVDMDGLGRKEEDISRLLLNYFALHKKGAFSHTLSLLFSKHTLLKTPFLLSYYNIALFRCKIKRIHVNRSTVVG
jgi:hypothetical protein